MAHKRLTSSDLFASPVNFFALGAGSGLAPVAPGTFGTLAAVPLALLLPANVITHLAVVAVLFVVGVWVCDQSSKRLGVHDHPGIVFDEWVGYFIAVVAVPRSFWLLALAFALFRLFDVLKPWPIGPLDKRVEGGLGIMVDDVVAGIFALVCLHLILFLLATFGVSIDALS